MNFVLVNHRTLRRRPAVQRARGLFEALVGDNPSWSASIQSSSPEPGPLTREAALDAIALAAALLFAHGQTTERTVVAAERLGRALGVPVTALPYWGRPSVEIDGKPA